MRCATGGPPMAAQHDGAATVLRGQRSTVARLCPRGALSHAVAYTQQFVGAAARRTIDSTPPPTAPVGDSLAGPSSGCGPGPSTLPVPTLSLSSVGGSSQLPARGREVNEHLHRMICCRQYLRPFPWSRRTTILHLAVYIYGSSREQR